MISAVCGENKNVQTAGNHNILYKLLIKAILINTT